jgi:ankyrin repeat protein
MLGIKHLLVGPTEDEIIINLAGNPDKLLIFASKESSIRCVEEALNGGASSKAKQQSLLLASKKGNLAIIQLLLEYGVNIHEKKDEAMREAAYHGQLEAVKLLVEKGCDIHIKNEEALAFAVSCHTNNGHLEVVQYLIDNDADIDISRKSHLSEWSNIRDAGIQGYLDNL